MGKTGVVVFMGLVSCALASHPASAAAGWEATGVTSRDQGYELGLKQLDAERYEAAIATFRAALERPEGEPSVTWQITLGLAWAHQQLGQSAFALGYYDAFLSQLDAFQAGGGKLTRKLRAKRRTALKLMKKLRAQVTRTHGVLEITSEPPGALVILDGTGAGPEGDARTPYRGYAPAGRHTVRLTMAGREPDEREVRVAPGQVVVIRAALAETPPPPPAPAPTRPAPTRPASSPPAPSPGAVAPPPAHAAAAPSTAWAGWVTCGVGLAAVATGTTFLVLSQGDSADAAALDVNNTHYEHDFDRLSARARERSTVGWIFTGVGAAAAAGGLVWALVAGGGDEGEGRAEAASVTVLPVRGGLAAGATWSF